VVAIIIPEAVGRPLLAACIRRLFALRIQRLLRYALRRLYLLHRPVRVAHGIGAEELVQQADAMPNRPGPQ